MSQVASVCFVAQAEIAVALSMAKAMAYRCHRRISRCGGHRDELESAACLAVAEAIPRYDPTRGVSLRTYAYHQIRRALFEHASPATDPAVAGVADSLKRAANRLRKAKACLAARGISRPSVEHLAAEASLSVATAKRALQVPRVYPDSHILDHIIVKPSGGHSGDPDVVPLFPIPRFDPDSGCPHHGRIRKGSMLCCMICHQTGIEGHPALRRDRRTDPEPDRRPELAQAGTETRRQRRQRQFQP